MAAEVQQPDAPGGKSESAAVDLEKIPVEQVLTTLGVKAEEGLTGAEAQKRLDQYGPNAIVEKEKSLAAKIAGYFMGPIAYMIEAAAVVSGFLGRWDDFIVIAGLLLFNAGLEFWQDRKASSALAALKSSLAPEATALRDGKWGTVKSADLVPGDIVKIRLGVIVPADLRLTNGDFASIDQAALTGESLPAAKKIGDEAYSGSVVKQGEMEGVVIGTGGNTFFGRTAKLVAGAGAISPCPEGVVPDRRLPNPARRRPCCDPDWRQSLHDILVNRHLGLGRARWTPQFVLVLLIASIPVAMPAVMSITMALGALTLSKQKAIVSRLSANRNRRRRHSVQDKTGTLTMNQLTLDAPISVRRASPPTTSPCRGSRLAAPRTRCHRHRGDEAIKDSDALRSATSRRSSRRSTPSPS